MARKTFSTTPSLRVTTLGEQYKRQRFSNDWRPAGFVNRYPYQAALQDEMPVLGGPTDQMGASPERFAPLSQAEESA